ncbi:MAG: hypothetical protein ABI894_08970 [Ilumatobacteraceae bacterium]
MSYTIVVSNAGPSDVVGAGVNDAFPSSLLGASWNCVAVNGTCQGSGFGSINTSVDLAVGGTATFTVTGTVSSTATGSITNTVTITPPSATVDPDPSNNSAADTDTLNAVTDLAITKTDNDSNTRPGDPINYQIVVTDNGPSAVTGAVVTDTMPAGLAGVSWTCTPSVGAGCAASGTGNLNELVDLDVGASVTFTVNATVTATAGTITNTAQVDAPAGATDPNTTDNVATDSTQVDPVGDLSITKTDGLTSAVPGAPTSYTIVVTNGGPSAALGVAVTDTLPSTLSGISWSCAASPGSSCGNAVGSGNISELVTIGGGGSISFAVDATIGAGETGVLANTATLTPPAGFIDTNSANNSATDVTDLEPTVDLAVAKTDGQLNAVPGTPITYSIVVTNSGPSVSVGSRIVDNLPATITGATWGCAASPGSACGAASGSGSIDEIVTVGVGGNLTYIVSANVSPSAVGMLVNTVSVTPPAGTTDSNLGNNSSNDIDTLTPRANLSIVKTDGAASVVPGTTITYSIFVANAGPSAVSGASVIDGLPAAITNATWTCTANAGGVCGTASGSGSIATTADLASGGSVTYTLTATIDAAASGTVANTATVAVPVGVADPDNSDNVSTDIDSLTPSVDLSITKTDNVTSAVPGTATTYTINVANSGPSTAVDAQITDVLTTEITGATWTCAATGGASCDTPTGSGDVSMLARLPVGGSVTVSLIASINPAATGFLVNSAVVTEPAGVIDTDPSDNVATDSDTLTPIADLSISKTDGLATALPGDMVTYTVVATNNGPSWVSGAVVTDTMPAGLTGVTWTCVPGAGSGCATPSGTGDISAAVDMAPGASALFTIDATIDLNQLGAVTNTATVDAPPGISDPDGSNNAATDSTVVNGLGDVAITKTDGVATVVAGTSTTYAIVVSNSGPSRIDGIQVVDPLPPVLLNAVWTCTSTGGATCGSASGSGSMNQMVDMPAASTVSYVVNADVAAGAQGTLTNAAAVSLPSGVVDSDLTNNDATDTTTIDVIADLAVTKTDNVLSLIPGNSVSYDVVVVNNGPSAVTDAAVTDNLPATITGASWTCTPSAGAVCGTSGNTGDVSLLADLDVGASVVVNIVGTVSPSAMGTLTNTAVAAPPVGASDPDGINNVATDTDTLDPVADVSVAKTNGVTSQSPGATSSYTITVANAGPSAAPGVSINDPLPAGATSASWTCSAAAGSSCSAATGVGAINTTVDLAAAGTVTFTVAMQAAMSAGTLTNTVTATVPPGITEPDPSNNVASDTDTLVFTADVSVTKVASAPTVAAGRALTYTVVVSNNGPDPASNVTVLDSVPAGLAGSSWVCTASAGSSCPASGTGDISVSVDLAAGGSATFTVTSTVTTSAPTTVVNTATVAVGPGTVDPDPTNNTASAGVTIDFTALLTIQKTASVNSAQPGDSFFYSIVVSNAGPARLDGVAISDPVPTGLTALSWTCFAVAGGVCQATSGTGSPLLDADLPLGASVTIIFNVRVAPEAAGSIVNVATATASSASQQTVAQASANIAVNPVVATSPALTLTKKTSATAYSTVGTTLSYSLVATNTGNAVLTNVIISDSNALVSGCGPVVLAPGESLICSARHVVTQTDLDQGAVSNTASASGTPATGTVVNATSATVLTPATRITNLVLAKSSAATGFARVGDSITYTISATNTGNVTLMNVAISDPNAVLSACPPRDLAPGQTVTCTAIHVVTAADIAANVIFNQAHATALPMVSLELVCPLLTASACPGPQAVSAESNIVTLSRNAMLPRAGSSVLSKLGTGLSLLGAGGLLLTLGRRRRRSINR